MNIWLIIFLVWLALCVLFVLWTHGATRKPFPPMDEVTRRRMRKRR